VIEAVRRFGWHPLPDPPRGEDDVFELWMPRDLARDLGAVRRSGRRLVATRAGRAEDRWRARACSASKASAARLGERTGTPQADLRARVLVGTAGGSWSHWNL